MSEKHRSGHGRHHHRHSLGYRIKRTLRHHRWILPTVILVAAALLATGVAMRAAVARQARLRVAASSPVSVGSYREITYKGRAYRYNSRITAILYAGLDTYDELVQTSKFTKAPRADSISLIVLDEYHRKMTIIALSRDTMTPIRKYTLNGKDRGMMTDHLGYAYTYGDGGETSARDLCEAVSQLLYGIPVHDYIVTSLASLPILSDAIGPVAVTVPNDDLASFGYLAGDTAVIDLSNLEWFVRTRDTDVDYSNVGRLQRQQAYIDGAMTHIRDMLENDSSGTWRILERAEAGLRTSITRNRYLDLIATLQNTVYDNSDYYIPEGEQVAASDHDEFYPDEEALLEKVIEIFYIEK